MAHIERIIVYDRVPYSEEGNERPSAYYPLGTIYYESGPYHPSGDRLFSELRVKRPYGLIYKAQYMHLRYQFEDGTDKWMYAWVDRVECISDSDENPVCAIHFHIDWWHSFFEDVSFGSGHVLRRPYSNDATTPIQGYSPKFWKLDHRTDAVPHKKLSPDGVSGTLDTWWVLIAAGRTTGTGSSARFSEMLYYSWPIVTDPNARLYGLSSAAGAQPQYFITAGETFYGKWDEYLGISPEQIYGAWILPCPPMGDAAITHAGSRADPLQNTGTNWNIDRISTTDQTSRCYYIASSNFYQGPDVYNRLFPETDDIAVPSGMISTERNPLHIVGFDGASVLQLPYGFTLSSYKYRVIVSATSCAIELRFDGEESRMEGLCAAVPALSLDLTENAWSEYVYSGQREWEIESRWNQSWKTGTESVASGATTGALMGGLGPAGALAGAATGSVGGIVSMATDFGWYNEATKKLKDDLMANQSPGILLQGNPWDAMFYGMTISFLALKMDDYSKDRIDGEVAEVGVAVDEYPTTFTIPSPKKGFYQVANLIVIGNVPVQARKEIAAMFAKGVRLI